MGTPHKGSWTAYWSRIPAVALGLVKSTNKSLLEVLETNSQYLESIHARFLSMMREQREAGRQLEVTCFFEELPLPTVGKVVSKESATFDGYDPITIHANHRDMVKFGSTEENGFKRVVGELTAWESEIGRTVVLQETNAWTANCAVRQKQIQTKFRTHYLPFPRNKNFVGREEIITELKRLLFTPLDGQQAALVGLGGVGKTQIALQLAHLVKNDDQSHRDHSVIWMNALSMATFELECTRMVNVFGIERGDKEDSKETFRNFLSSEKARKWFLIIDNADNIENLYGTAQEPGGIAEFIPDCEHGYVLFTTRSLEVAVTVAQKNILELPEMNKKDAIALLQGPLTQKDQMQDTVAIDKLLHELAYLPLAITQASAYMKMNKISIKEYLRLLQNTDQDMVELLSVGFRDRTHYHHAQGAVVTTWIVSFNRIRSLHKEAATLLSFIAYLEPKAIPKTLLPPLGSEQSMTSAIGTLCGYSFLSQREDGDLLDMHSLVHLAMRRWNEDESHEKGVRQMTLVRIAEVFPTNDWVNRNVWRQYLPHALRLLTNIADIESEEVCTLGYWVSRCLQVDGRIREAVGRLEHVVAVRDIILSEDHPSRLASQHELAGAYGANGQIDKAVKLLEHVVAMKRRTLSEDHLSRLASQHELAGAYGANGQIDKAMELLEYVVAVKRGTMSPTHRSRLVSEELLEYFYGVSHGLSDQSSWELNDLYRIFSS